jgi:hypothetical protein
MCMFGYLVCSSVARPVAREQDIILFRRDQLANLYFLFYDAYIIPFTPDPKYKNAKRLQIWTHLSSYVISILLLANPLLRRG